MAVHDKQFPKNMKCLGMYVGHNRKHYYIIRNALNETNVFSITVYG